jgi:hypothetical protein
VTAALGAWWARLRERAARAPVRVVARVALGHGHGVALLEVEGGRRVLVGLSPQGIARLASWRAASPAGEGGAGERGER